MRNTITLNGVESSTIPGLLIQELPAISKPLMRTEVETIDGRDGDITTDLGFSAYDKQISIGLFGDFDINQVIAYFNSKGTVIFSNEPDKFYNYQIVDQIDFERLVRYRTATVTMHCQPFKYSTTEGADILSTNSNFATLDQSINSDASNFSYSSNVQADVTATRTTTTGGGKFFATFTMNVAQGVTYYFSGNAANNCTMYGYKDRIWGTSAGFSGRKLPQFPSYTATYTGTLIIGFYSVTTEPVFIRNFKVSNQSTSTVSGEGTNIMLENSAEASFSRFDLKGNTEQTTYAGKNLYNVSTLQTGTYTTVDSDGWITMARDNSSGSSTTYINAWTSNLALSTSTKYDIFMEVAAVSGDGGEIAVCSTASDSGQFNSWQVRNIVDLQANHLYLTSPVTKSDFTGITGGLRTVVTLPAGKKFSIKFRLSVLPNGTETTSDFSYEPYVGGIPAPNPYYPQDVEVVTGLNTVNISGKNRLKLKQPSSSSQGVLSTITNGVIHAVGTITSDWSNISAHGAVYIPAGTYYFSITEKLPCGIAVRLYFEDGLYVNYSINQGSVGRTITLSKPAVYAYLYIHSLTSGTLIDLTVMPQLEKGSASTAFEPYTEETYAVELASANKNIFDGKMENGSHNSSTGAKTNSDTTCRSVNATPVQPNTAYTFSINGEATDISVRVLFYGINGGYINSINISDLHGTFTTPSNCYSIRWHSTPIKTAYPNNDALVQIEQGSEATSYIANALIELCKIGDYQDYFYKSGDKWYKHKAIEKLTNGNLFDNRQGQSDGTSRFYYAASGSATASTSVLALSNKFKGITYDERNQHSGESWVFANGNIAVQTDVADTLTNFKTWFNQNSAVIYYALATAVEIEITNQTLIDQLESINQAYAHRTCTYINASAATGNVPHIIAAEVATDPSGTITNSGNIYSKPKLTIFGSGSVGVYLNGVQMFQIALDTNDHITIDTALMEAYQDNLQTLKNRSVTGDYNNFKLPVGESEISFSGSVTMCVVENYSRWL